MVQQKKLKAHKGLVLTTIVCQNLNNKKEIGSYCKS